MKLPAFQFYVGDWRKDPGVQALDFFTRGVWFEMLCLMHESDERGVLLLNGKPMPDEALLKLLGISEIDLGLCMAKLEAFGIFSKRNKDLAIFSRRMCKDERTNEARRKAGRTGGNPSLVNQKSSKAPTKGEAKDEQNIPPSSSSSVNTNVFTTSPSPSEDFYKDKNLGRWWKNANPKILQEKLDLWKTENPGHTYPPLLFTDFFMHYSTPHEENGIRLNQFQSFGIQQKLYEMFTDPNRKGKYVPIVKPTRKTI